MTEKRRATDSASVLATHLPFLLQAAGLLIVGAMAWATLKSDMGYLRRDVDELRQQERFLHGDIHVPESK